MLTRLALLLALLAAPLSLLAAEHTKDSLETIKKATADKTAVLVDVREADEWKAGHVAGATFLPLSVLKGSKAEAVAKKLPKDKIVYTYCRAGRRSVAAAELLEKLGYDVRPLKPGFEDLIKGGFEKETGEPKK
jgi:phage shock protein E